MKLNLFLLLGFLVTIGHAQDDTSNYRSKTLPVSDTIQIDSVSINPKKFQIFNASKKPIDSLKYEVNFEKGYIILAEEIKKSQDSITIKYLRYPKFLTRDYFVLDPKIIVEHSGDIDKLYALQDTKTQRTFTPFEGLNTVGSISRGVTVGNNQNAVVNSELDLQITGKLSEKEYSKFDHLRRL